MKNKPEILARWDIGEFIGDGRSSGYVTVEPGWGIHLDDLVFNGRWFQSQSGVERVEVAVPNIKSIQIERGLDTDAGSCTIEIYNTINYELTDGTPAIPPTDLIPGIPPTLGEHYGATLLSQTYDTDGTVTDYGWVTLTNRTTPAVSGGRIALVPGSGAYVDTGTSGNRELRFDFVYDRALAFGMASASTSNTIVFGPPLNQTFYNDLLNDSFAFLTPGGAITAGTGELTINGTPTTTLQATIGDTIHVAVKLISSVSGPSGFGIYELYAWKNAGTRPGTPTASSDFVMPATALGPYFSWYSSFFTAHLDNLEVQEILDWGVPSDPGTPDIPATPGTPATPGSYGPDFNANVFGVPGYFTPGRGWSPEAARWNQTPNVWSGDPTTGALPYLTHMSLLRTYQGYGAWSGGEPMDWADAVASGLVALTGTWIVDTVSIGSDGILSLKCRDAAKLLIEQFLYPPIAPTSGSNAYPIKYYRWVTAGYDREWDPSQTPAGGTTEVWPAMAYYNSNTDIFFGMDVNGPDSGANGGNALNFPVNGQFPANPAGPPYQPWHGENYGLSGGMPTSTAPNGYEFWEFNIAGPFNRVWVANFRGACQVFISVKVNGVWQGTQTVPYAEPFAGYGDPYGTIVPFVVQGGLNGTPQVGDGQWFNLPQNYSGTLRLRVTMRDSWDSGNIYGDPLDPAYLGEWRATYADVRASFLSSPVAPGAVDSTGYAMARFPGVADGFWVVNINGLVYPIGDAGDLGASGRQFSLQYSAPVVAIEELPVENPAYPAYGWGFWELELNGVINATDGADHWGQITYPSDGLTISPSDFIDSANFIDMASTNTGRGYWVLRATGQVYAFGDAVLHGSLTGLTTAEGYAAAIAGDPTGNGYWIVDRFGAVHNYGSAMALPNFAGTTIGNPPGSANFREVIANSTGTGLWGLFDTGVVQVVGTAQLFTSTDGLGHTDAAYAFDYTNSLRTNFWTMSRTNSNGGYRILRVDGHLYYFGDAIEFTPTLITPTQRTAGNYTDYADIIKDILAWSGFVLHETNAIHGNIETTGVWSEDDLEVDLFDKKAVIDIVTMIKEIVGYHFWIDDEGGVRFESPNWWAPGNKFEDGTFTTLIPSIDELYHLTGYSAQLSDSDLRSEIIIANYAPTANNTGTVITRQTPQGAQYLRGMQRPAIWTNEVFLKPAEQQAMAELIALHIFFAMRQGHVECIANPCIQINDQVSIFEMVSGESFIHYVRSMSTQHDLDTGVYKMTLGTNWLGSGTQWAIQPGPVSPPPIGGGPDSALPPGTPPPPAQAPPPGGGTGTPPPDGGGGVVIVSGGGGGPGVAIKTGAADYTVGIDGTLQQIVDTQVLANKIIRVPAGTYNAGAFVLYAVNKDFGGCQILCDPAAILRGDSGVELYGQTMNLVWSGGVVEVNGANVVGEGFQIDSTRTDKGANGNPGGAITIHGVTIRPQTGTGAIQRNGLAIWGCDLLEVSNNVIHDAAGNAAFGTGSAGSGISIGHGRRLGDVGSPRVLINSNLIYNMRETADGPADDRNGIIFDLYHCNSAVVYPDHVIGDIVVSNNEVHDVDGRGIHILRGGLSDSLVTVTNNYVHGVYGDNLGGSAPDSGIGGYGAGICGNMLVNNNVVVPHGAHPAYEFISFDGDGPGVLGSGNTGAPVVFEASRTNTPPAGF